MNTLYENPEDIHKSPQFDYAYDTSFMFDVKRKVRDEEITSKDMGVCMGEYKMVEKRAKHCMTIVQDPHDSYNKLIIAIGGINITHYRDLFKK